MPLLCDLLAYTKCYTYYAQSIVNIDICLHLWRQLERNNIFIMFIAHIFMAWPKCMHIYIMYIVNVIKRQGFK